MCSTHVSTHCVCTYALQCICSTNLLFCLLIFSCIYFSFICLQKELKIYKLTHSHVFVYTMYLYRTWTIYWWLILWALKEFTFSYYFAEWQITWISPLEIISKFKRLLVRVYIIFWNWKKKTENFQKNT